MWCRHYDDIKGILVLSKAGHDDRKTVNNATLWVYLAFKLNDERKDEEYSSVVVTCISLSLARRGVGEPLLTRGSESLSQ